MEALFYAILRVASGIAIAVIAIALIGVLLFTLARRMIRKGRNK